MKTDPTALRRCQWIAVASAFFAICSGMIVLVGWAFHIEPLKCLLSGQITMKANTALCLSLAGAALWLLHTPRTNPAAPSIGRILATVLLLIASATLSEHLLGWNLRIDQLLFTEPPGATATASPGRMGPPASTALSLCAIGLLTLHVTTRRGRVPSQFCAIAVALIALLSLIGYAYEIHSLYILAKWTGIAAHTSVALMMLAVGILCARAPDGFMQILCSEGAGGMLLRRLLVPALVVPFALGWLRTVAQHHGIVDEAVGRPAFILAITGMLIGLIWWHANSVARLDEQRARADDERQRAQQQAADSNARFRRVADCGMIGIVFGDIHGNIHDANDAFLNIIQRSRDQLAAGKLRWFDMTPPEHLDADRRAVKELLETGIARPFEKEYIRPDGTRVPIMLGAAFLEGSRTETVAFVLDLSQRRRAEELLRQQRDEILHLARVTTVGEMAAGLAHELNQPLGAIMNYAGAALDDASRHPNCPPSLVETLHDIAAESRRAGDIIRRLRNFVRKQQPRVANVEINSLIRDTLTMLESELRKGAVQWTLDLQPDLPLASADPVLVQQVVVNLLRNAVDAMENLPPPQRRLTVRSQAGESIRVAVSDCGCGNASTPLVMIFDAFYTTKEKGMGMGLSISRSIIEAHRGHIRAVANPSAGLTIEFTLPLATSKEHHEPQHPAGLCRG